MVMSYIMGYNVLWKWLFVLGVIWVRNEMDYTVMDQRVYESTVILVICNIRCKD